MATHPSPPVHAHTHQQAPHRGTTNLSEPEIPSFKFRCLTFFHGNRKVTLHSQFRTCLSSRGKATEDRPTKRSVIADRTVLNALHMV